MCWRRGLRNIVPFLALGLVLTGPAIAAPSTLDRAETAVKQIQAGDLRAAAVTTRQALDADPGEPLLHNLAATLLLMTGDVNGAASEYASALRDLPGDGLALYGLGLASTAHGDLSHAMEQLESAERTGDRTYCLLAERYVENLTGAVGSGAGLSLPDSFAASTKALDGMAAARSGDSRRALSELSGAIDALPGDPTAEPLGLSMTFDRASPFRFGGGPLPTGNGLAAPRSRRDKPFSGVVSLTPDALGSDAGYVVFKIDGALSIVNVAPFKLIWDTSTVPNGVHKVEIIAYDKQGQQLSRAAKTLRTSNANAPVRQTPDAQRQERIRAALWQNLMLRPSRLSLAYTAAEAARAVGDQAAVERYLALTAAIEPNYRDTRTRLASLGGSVAEAALWRGSTGDHVVALTFDDGPKPGVTEQLLAVLTRERVPATFFVIGRHTTAYPVLTRKIVEAGMQIENHTYTHQNLTLLPADAIERELLRTMVSVQSATGRRMRYYRPPGGNMNADVSRIAARWGLTACMWTLDGEALENGSPDRLIDYVVQKACPGAIVLLHNGRMTTIEALPKIIAGLRKRGFEFVTIDQLVQRKAQLTSTGQTVGAAQMH